MKDINNCIFTGRLTRDPELKYTKTGIQVLSFSLAVNSVKKVNEKYEDEANFFDFTLFGKRAEFMGDILKKGMKITVSSEARQERWQSEQGNRSKVKFIVNDISLPDKKNENQPSQARSSGSGSSQDSFKDDIPF